VIRTRRNADDRARRAQRDLALDPHSVEARVRSLQELLRQGLVSATILRKCAKIDWAPAVALFPKEAHKGSNLRQSPRWILDHPWWRNANQKVQVWWAAAQVALPWITSEWVKNDLTLGYQQELGSSLSSQDVYDMLVAGLQASAMYAERQLTRSKIIPLADQIGAWQEMTQVWEVGDALANAIDIVDMIIFSAVYGPQTGSLDSFREVTFIDRAVWRLFDWHWADERFELRERVERVNGLRDQLCEAMVRFDVESRQKKLSGGR